MLKILEAKCLLYRALLEKDSEVQIILNKFKKK